MMKKSILSIIALILLTTTGCQKLDLNPLSEGSSENWYKNENEIVLALNDLYRGALWPIESNRLFHTDRFTDDWNQRESIYEWIAGSITSEFGDAVRTWGDSYKGIARATAILNSLDNAAGNIQQDRLNQLKGEASFFRACFYSYLVFLYGDVPLVTDYMTIEEAFETGRTDKAVVLEQIYKDFDVAIQYLPVSSTGVQRATKGAAYAFKARIATWMLDYPTARDAAKACMDLRVYSLHADYRELFLKSTTASPELIFTIPRSRELEGAGLNAASFVTRTSGGTATAQPSWELFATYTCRDGLPIDQSPLFDPQNPFKNRDPRCAATNVEFGTPHLGFIYDPGVAQVLNLTTNQMVTNRDALLNDQFAAYNGMCLRKFVDQSWADLRETDMDLKLMRYADVLLMYAEAKIELNEIDASTLAALNQVRARAYKVNTSQTTLYPSITETDQVKLRKIFRMERRVELAWEGRRWFDLIRWRLAEVSLTRPVYALPIRVGLIQNIASGDYFWPKNTVPKIDDNGLADFTDMYATGKIRAVVPRNFSNRQYLYPIPFREVLINKNITQNPGY